MQLTPERWVQKNGSGIDLKGILRLGERFGPDRLKIFRLGVVLVAAALLLKRELEPFGCRSWVI
jgi:hypothetical protein